MFFFRNKKDWLLFGVVFLLTGAFLFLFQGSFQNKNVSLDYLPLEVRRTIFVKNSSLFILIQDLSSSNLVLKKIDENNSSLNFSPGTRPIFLALNGSDVKDFQQLKENFLSDDWKDVQVINLVREIFDSSYQEKDFFWVSPQNLERIISFLARFFGQLDPINRNFYLDQAYEKIISLRKISQWIEENRFSFPRNVFILADKRWVSFLEEIGFRVNSFFEINSFSSKAQLFEELAFQLKGKKNSFILLNSDFPNEELELFLKERGISTRLIILKGEGDESESFEEILHKNLSKLNLFFK